MSESISSMLKDYDHKCPSNTGFIIAIVILLLLLIGLSIWLIYIYVRGDVGPNKDRLVRLAGAKIVASDTTITGSWGKLDDEKDKVTLYVSEKPFIFNDDGTITANQTTVKSESKTGSNNSADINITKNTSYNAVLIATGENTSHYKIYGPKTVFTQTNADLGNNIFNIKDLTSCNGGVSETVSYTTLMSDLGHFRLGPANTDAHKSSKSFVLKYGPNDPNGETNNILCRKPLTTMVELGVWANKNTDESAEPIICPPGTTGDTCAANEKIPLNHCQWNYNTLPSDVTGQNKWCLSTTQSLSNANPNNKDTVCLVRNGPSMSVTNASSADTWFNAFVTSGAVN